MVSPHYALVMITQLPCELPTTNVTPTLVWPFGEPEQLPFLHNQGFPLNQTGIIFIETYFAFLLVLQVCKPGWMVSQGDSAMQGWDIAQALERSPVKVCSLLHGGFICNLGYFPFQAMVHNLSINDCGMCCPVCGKVHIKRSLTAYWKEYAMWQHRISSKEICHNGHMLDFQ